jgi:hypothetical protein
VSRRCRSRAGTKEDSDEEAPSTIAAQGNERTKMLKALKGESTRSLVDVLPTLPIRRRGPEAIPLRPVTETTHNYMEQFWYVQHPGPHFTFDTCVELNSRRAISATMLQTRPRPPRDTHVSREQHPTPHRFDMIRLSTLMTAIYIVIFALVYLDDLLVGNDEAFDQRGGLVGGLCILLIAILPPLLVLRKVTRILEDFVVVANISDLKNRRTIEIVLRRQKTVAAFEALKVVQCLRDPKMLLRVVRTQRLFPLLRCRVASMAIYASRVATVAPHAGRPPVDRVACI